MFVRKKTIELGDVKTMSTTLVPDYERVKILPSGDILVIENDEEKFTLKTFNEEGLKNTVDVDIANGQLVGILPYKDSLWLEFHNMLAPYEEDYTVISVKESGLESKLSFARESYLHELAWHKLYIKDGLLCLNLIRHNRLHHYAIDFIPEEVDVLEGGQWYLCGTHAICAIGDTLEIYDESLNLCNTLEYDYEIDEIKYCYSDVAEVLFIALTDLGQEQTAILAFHTDTQAVYTSFTEHAIMSVGTAGGRMWLNPYGFNMKQDLGGCIVCDKYAWPLYTHLRSKEINGTTFGTYPPPFHRSYAIYPLPQGAAAVVEQDRILVLDHKGHGVQEIGLTHHECMGISENGMQLAVLKLKRDRYCKTEAVTHEDAVLEIFEWSEAEDGGKVVEMIKFRK